MIEIPHGSTNVICHSSSKQYLGLIMLNGLSAGGVGRKADTHVIHQSCIRKKANQYLTRKVGEHSSFPTFITSGIPIRSMKLIWSKHNIRVPNSINHSVMLLCTSERFQQTVLQSRWSRSNDLVRKTSRSRTARTGNLRRFLCIG